MRRTGPVPRAGELSPAKRELLVRLREAGAAAGGRPAGGPVPLRPGSGPPAVVLLHPVGGALFCYARLVAALREPDPVVGFAADLEDPGGPDAALLPALAARYRSRLPPARPGQRPPVLAGWSMGGLLAYELAQQLLAATGVPHPVVLLDSVYLTEPIGWGEPELRRAFVADLGRLSGVPAARLPDPGRPGDPVATVDELLIESGIDPGLQPTEVQRRFQVFRVNTRAMLAYRPRPYPGPVSALWTAGTGDRSVDWRRLVGGPVATRTVPGDHYGLFEPGRVEVAAALIDRAVRAG